MNKRSSGFTLVEILVVLGIIALLAALLFPAFGRAREGSRQTNCMSNNQQIALAVSQYRKDEGHFPDSLLDLLGEGMRYDDGSPTGGTLGNRAPGYLKSGMDSLVCPDDDTDTNTPRSSYGRLSKTTLTTPLPDPVPDTFAGDYAAYVWNYWGTRPDGFTYADAADAETHTLKAGSSSLSDHGAVAATPASQALMDPTRPYNYPGLATYCNQAPINVIKYSMSNRFAPPSTIITHCVYHRLPTANGLNNPGEMYADTNNSLNARDIVARVEPSVKNSEISTWKTSETWQKQLP